VNKNNILLDSANPNILKNIRNATKPIAVHCNAGSTTTNLEGELWSMTVKHYPYSIATVLSHHSVRQQH
jgi:hypothetical protein